MHSALLKIATTPGTESRQIRLGLCRIIEDWALLNGYVFRNLYPGIHEPYRNRASGEAGPHPDTFDYPVTWLLVEGSGAYDRLSDTIDLLLPGPGDAYIRVALMRWIDEDRDGAPAPEDMEMHGFRMPWEPVHVSRSEMAVRLTCWPDKSVVAECCESRYKSHNVETGRQILRSLLYHRNAFPPSGTPAVPAAASQASSFPEIVLFPDPAAALAATPFFIEEAGVGCWGQTTDEAVLQQGERRPATRYALHIPSETWYRELLDAASITAFIVAARGIGLRQVSRATGFWTLGSGLLQREPLHIAWSDEAVNLHLLRTLARRILHEGEQEAVAIEVAGMVEMVRS